MRVTCHMAIVWFDPCDDNRKHHRIPILKFHGFPMHTIINNRMLL